MREACTKLCFLLDMLVTTKHMNILHYYRDMACLRTNIGAQCYSYDAKYNAIGSKRGGGSDGSSLFKFHSAPANNSIAKLRFACHAMSR